MISVVSQLFVVVLVVFSRVSAFVTKDFFRIPRRQSAAAVAITEQQSLQHLSTTLRGSHRINHLLHASNNDWLSQITPDPSTDDDDKLTTQSDSTAAANDLPPENVHIPSTGVSVTDELQKSMQEKFDSVLVPITGLPSVAQIVTTSSSDGITEPVRYLASLSPISSNSKQEEESESGANDKDNNQEKSTSDEEQSFVLVDIPPFSDKLAANMRRFMSKNDGNGKLVAMLITSRDAIHYDEAPAVYTTRRSDLYSWTLAFPEAQVIAYRLDVPRDCRDMITQRLDGYGPWALDESHESGNVTFVETGRPLTYEEWDEDVTKQVMEEGTTPPDDDLNDDEDSDLYTPEAIREREEGKRVLAIYTPGHTFGSVTYIFPEIQACFSGYTIPFEDDRYDESMGTAAGGPALDFRGYITTNKGGMDRMMESARNVVDTYSDRFMAVLPSRGDPLFVDGSEEDRREALHYIIDQYGKIGRIYEQLGIISQKE